MVDRHVRLSLIDVCTASRAPVCGWREGSLRLPEWDCQQPGRPTAVVRDGRRWITIRGMIGCSGPGGRALGGSGGRRVMETYGGCSRSSRWRSVASWSKSTLVVGLRDASIRHRDGSIWAFGDDVCTRMEGATREVVRYLDGSDGAEVDRSQTRAQRQRLSAYPSAPSAVAPG